MQKKIMYVLAGKYNKYEAISKEIDILRKNFKNSFISLSENYKIQELYKNLKLLSHLVLPGNKYDIMHVFLSGENVTHIKLLNLLQKKPVVLQFFSDVSGLKNIHLVKKFAKVIVESEKDRKILLKKGISSKKIEIIYPSIKITAEKTKGNANTVLFASSPLEKQHFKTRGVNILAEAFKDKALKNFKLILLWRNKFNNIIRKKIGSAKNIVLVNKLMNDVKTYYKKAGSTIAPFTTSKENKRCPRSIVESLANGKPVLVSDNIGVTDIIKKEKCGIVFEPTKQGIINAVKNLDNNYAFMKKNSKKTAKKYFDVNKNIAKYRKIYS